MNKHIEDLLYQSGLIADGCWDELGTYEQEAIERLVNITVKECANLADEAEPFLASDLIKRHFGIEE
jgi:hypothetical protein